MNVKKEEKQELVAKLKEKLAGSKAVFFADYRGLTVAQISDLREKLKEAKAQLFVAKNTLIMKALRGNSYLSPRNQNFNLAGPTAVIFAQDDQIAPTKIIAQFAKTHGLPSLKSGFLGKSLLGEREVQRLASLPTREVLISQTVGQISSSLYDLVYTLQANLQNLIFVLKNKSENIQL